MTATARSMALDASARLRTAEIEGDEAVVIATALTSIAMSLASADPEECLECFMVGGHKMDCSRRSKGNRDALVSELLRGVQRIEDDLAETMEAMSRNQGSLRMNEKLSWRFSVLNEARGYFPSLLGGRR